MLITFKCPTKTIVLYYRIVGELCNLGIRTPPVTDTWDSNRSSLPDSVIARVNSTRTGYELETPVSRDARDMQLCSFYISWTALVTEVAPVWFYGGWESIYY